MIALLLGLAAGADLSRCDDVYAFPGTARYQVAMDARESTAQLFGAAGFAEDVLFPSAIQAREDSDGGFAVAGLQAMEMFGGLSVAALEKPWDCPYGATMRDMDMYASAFGVAAGKGPATVFISTGATAMISWNQTYLRNAGFISMPMVMSMAAMAAPVWIAVDDNVMWQNDPQGIFADFIIGAQLDAGPGGVASAGWSGTEGPYANYTHPKVHATASVALSGDLKRLPYGLLGVRGLPLDKDGIAGKTSLYARQLGHVTTALNEPLQLNVRSVHFEQLDLIGGKVDIRTAAVISPEVQLGEARVGVGSWSDDGEGTAGGVKLVAGVYDQPDFFFWGVEGGMRPSVTVESAMQFDTIRFGFLGGWNEPGMLRRYPYAVDNLSFQVQGTFGGAP